MKTRKIILIGFKGSGKTSVGRIIADKTGVVFVDTDRAVEGQYLKLTGCSLSVREIYRQSGPRYLQKLETEVLVAISKDIPANGFVLSCGGNAALTCPKLIRSLGFIVLLEASPEILTGRILRNGIPAFFPFPEDPLKSVSLLNENRRSGYESLADFRVDTSGLNPDQVAEIIMGAES